MRALNAARRRVGALSAAAAVAALITGACHHAARGATSDARAAAPAASVAPDSLVGIVRVVGMSASPQTVLAPGDGRPAVTLVGSAVISRVAGLGVVVFGVRAGQQFTVSSFRVVSASGVPATDGLLRADGDVLTLVTSAGERFVLGRPAVGLRAIVGHRVWVSGSLERETVAYGVIE